MNENQDQVEVQDQGNTEGQAVPQDQQSNDIEKRISELEKRYKAETQGLNKRNSELEKQLKEIEREKMTEAERRKAEESEWLTKQETLKKETLELERQKSITEALYENELPKEFRGRIAGQTPEEIAEDAKVLKALLQETAQNLADKMIKERLSGSPPKPGSAVGIDTQIEAAKKAGNIALAVKLRREQSMNRS